MAPDGKYEVIPVDRSEEVQYDEKGRPLVKYCPLCGISNPEGVWGGEEVAAILKCRGCGCNVLIDIGPEMEDDNES